MKRIPKKRQADSQRDSGEVWEGTLVRFGGGLW